MNLHHNQLSKPLAVYIQGAKCKVTILNCYSSKTSWHQMTAVNTTAHNAQSAMRGSSCPCWPLKFLTNSECILGTCRCRNTKRFHLQRRFYLRPSILNSMKRRMQWPAAYHSQRSTDGMTTKRGRACVCLLPDFHWNLSKFVHIQNFQLADAQQCSDHDFLVSFQQLLAADAHRSDRCQSAVKPHTRTYGLFFRSSTK